VPGRRLVAGVDARDLEPGAAVGPGGDANPPAVGGRRLLDDAEPEPVPSDAVV